MKIHKAQDCEVTSPPSTAFVLFPECESDLAYIAEQVDLPTANRFNHKLLGIEDDNEGTILQAQNTARTTRVSVTSLAAQMGMPNATPEYQQELLTAVEEAFGLDRKVILSMAFFQRSYHF